MSKDEKEQFERDAMIQFTKALLISSQISEWSKLAKEADVPVNIFISEIAKMQVEATLASLDYGSDK